MKCRYIDEKQFDDFKENFHILIETLNHNVTSMKDDIGTMKINTALMTNSMKNITKITWGIVGVLTTIGVAVVSAILTKII